MTFGYSNLHLLSLVLFKMFEKQEYLVFWTFNSSLLAHINLLITAFVVLINRSDVLTFATTVESFAQYFIGIFVEWKNIIYHDGAKMLKLTLTLVIGHTDIFDDIHIVIVNLKFESLSEWSYSFTSPIYQHVFNTNKHLRFMWFIDISLQKIVQKYLLKKILGYSQWWTYKSWCFCCCI